MNEPTIQCVVFHKPGRAWQAGVPYREQPGVMAHVQHYLQWHQQGKLALGGPFMDDRGGMMIAKSDITREELETFAAQDPTVISGLLTYEVVEWRVVMRGDE